MEANATDLPLSAFWVEEEMGVGELIRCRRCGQAGCITIGGLLNTEQLMALIHHLNDHFADRKLWPSGN